MPLDTPKSEILTTMPVPTRQFRVATSLCSNLSVWRCSIPEAHCNEIERRSSCVRLTVNKGKQSNFSKKASIFPVHVGFFGIQEIPFSEIPNLGKAIKKLLEGSEESEVHNTEFRIQSLESRSLDEESVILEATH